MLTGSYFSNCKKKSRDPDTERFESRWEQLALYEFFKSKTAAKKKKEEELAQGLRDPSPPPSPLTPSEDKRTDVNGGRNGVKSPVRRRFRSESPEDDERSEKGEGRRGRSRSGSPKARGTSSRHRRSRSGSTSPRRRRSRSRSRSRSNSPYATPSFQRQRSPVAPTES